MKENHLAPDINLKHWQIRLHYFPQLALLGTLVSVISRYSSFPSHRILLAETLMQLVGMAAVYTFWAYSSKILRHFDKNRLTRAQIMFIGAIGGLIMGASQSFLSWLFQIPLQINFPLRVLGNVVVAAFWLPLMSVVFGNFRRYSKLKYEIREEFLQQESVRLTRQRALEEYRKKIERDIQNSLEVTTGEANRLFSSLDSESSRRLPDRLREISTNYFRLTAHKMEATVRSLEPRPLIFKSNFLEFKAAVLHSVATRPLNPAWFAIVIVVTISIPLTAKAKYLLIPEILLTTGLSAYLVQRLLLSIFSRLKSHQFFATLIATSASIGLPIVLAHLIPGNIPTLGNHIAYGIVVIILTCLGHIAQAGLLKEDELRSSSADELLAFKSSEKEQNAEFSRITRDWARYIHGNFTTKLEASALAIETAVESEDSEAIELAIREVEKTLKLDITRYRSNPQVLIQEVRDRCENWQGLVHINIDSRVSADVVVASIKDVGDCIEEALLNAVRHGDCSSVSITIADLATSISIRVCDNGRGFSGKSKGFGSSIYEESTHGNWNLWRDEKNQLTILELIFAKA